MTEDMVPTNSRKQRSTRPDGSFYSSDPKERYAQLVEDGKLGPQFGKLGGRPRKPRAAEAVAEFAREEAEQIKAAFRDALDEDNHPRVRMEAANALLKIEHDEDKLKLDEDEFDRLSVDDQAAAIVGMLDDPLIQAALNPANDSDPTDS